MSANVETMFYVREKPWHGLGTEVKEAPTSADALVYAGLDWTVDQKNVYAEDGALIPGYKVNIRSTDNATLGIVSDRYKVVQNEDAFQFTDDLLGAGVTYETAGALQGGRKVWMLARMPQRYIIAGDEIAPYLVVMSSHDGSSGVKVAMTPIRVVCQNTLNLALGSAKRIWTTKHTENVMSRVHETRETLMLAEAYMSELGRGIDELSQIRLSDRKVMEFMQEIFPVGNDVPEGQRKNNMRSAFWNHVKNVTPPPLDGSDASAKFLSERFPNSVPKSQIELPDTAADLLAQYDEACEQLEVVTEQKQKAENLLKEMLGENEIGTSGDRIIAWKNITQERLDSKTLKAEHPTLCKKYTNKTSYRRFTIKTAS